MAYRSPCDNVDDEMHREATLLEFLVNIPKKSVTVEKTVKYCSFAIIDEMYKNTDLI